MAATKPSDVDRMFAKALSAGDLEGALAMYEPDGCYVLPDGTTATGHDEIRQALAHLISLNATLDCHAISVVENGNLAVLQADWIFRGTGVDGIAFENTGRSIEIVRRQADGTWLFAIDLPEGSESALSTG